MLERKRGGRSEGQERGDDTSPKRNFEDVYRKTVRRPGRRQHRKSEAFAKHLMGPVISKFVNNVIKIIAGNNVVD